MSDKKTTKATKKTPVKKTTAAAKKTAALQQATKKAAKTPIKKSAAASSKAKAATKGTVKQAVKAVKSSSPKKKTIAKSAPSKVVSHHKPDRWICTQCHTNNSIHLHTACKRCGAVRLVE